MAFSGNQVLQWHRTVKSCFSGISRCDLPQQVMKLKGKEEPAGFSAL